MTDAAPLDGRDAARPGLPALTRAAVRDRGDVLGVIAAGGALGSVARWGLTLAFPHGRDGIPWGTWIANVTGALALGVLMVLVLEALPPSRYLRPFWAIGVLGGYTTLSTFMQDTGVLLLAGHPWTAGAYLLGTLVTGLGAAYLGMRGTRVLIDRRRRRAARAKERST